MGSRRQDHKGTPTITPSSAYTTLVHIGEAGIQAYAYRFDIQKARIKIAHIATADSDARLLRFAPETFVEAIAS